MDGEPNTTTEKLVKPDPHAENVALANKAFMVASRLLNAENPDEPQRYKHLESVANLGHLLTMDDEKMTASLQQMGYDERHAQAIPAIYMGKRGGVIVDAIIIRKDTDIKPLIIFHEFVHRAAEQAGLQERSVHFDEQMYQLLDFPREISQEMKIKSPKKYRHKLAETKEMIRIVNEGLTQWATLYLANRTPQFNPPVEDEVYSDEVAAVSEWFHDTLSRKGMTDMQIETLMLDLALTGDFAKVKAALPLGKDLQGHGFRDDFYVSNLFGGIQSSFMLKRFDRILGKLDSSGTPQDQNS